MYPGDMDVGTEGKVHNGGKQRGGGVTQGLGQYHCKYQRFDSHICIVNNSKMVFKDGDDIYAVSVVLHKLDVQIVFVRGV